MKFKTDRAIKRTIIFVSAIFGIFVALPILSGNPMMDTNKLLLYGGLGALITFVASGYLGNKW